MKRNLLRNLLVLMLITLGIGSARADLIWYEGYSYINGRIDIVSTNVDGSTNWARHSGSGNDAIVTNNIELVGSGGSTPSRSDDVHRNLTNYTTVYTNSPMLFYASFTINVTQLPGGTTNAGYFAHFLNGSSSFYGKVWSVNGSLPGTYRLGTSGTSSSAVTYFPVDLATNVPYQVVISYDDASTRTATLWINPLSQSDSSVQSSDVVTNAPNLMSFAFRQGAGSIGGTWTFSCGITNLALATTFPEAATNVASTNAVAPTIVYPLVAGYTNSDYITFALSVVANGQSLENLTYQWQLDGTNISTLPDGSPVVNSNVLSFPSPQTNDTGLYTVIVTTPYGLSVTSTTANVVITNSTSPPFFLTQPANASGYPAQNVTLSVTANGVPPITYQWNYGGAPIIGANNNTYTVTDLQSGNGTTGIYECDVINGFGTNHSSNATVSLILPTSLSIFALRGEVDNTFFLPTNSATAYYTVTGTVLNRTNMAASPNYQAAITDGSAGISVYCYGGLANPPNLGDVIQVTGPVDNYNSLEEFEIYSTDPSTSVTVISSNNPAPLPTVLSLTFTNSPIYGTPTNIAISNALHRFESTLVMLTNVYIVGGGGTNTVVGQDYTLTDQSGTNSIIYYAYYGLTDIIGQPLPGFCYTLTGIMSEYLGATVPNRSSGYEFWVTSYSDFVTNQAPTMTLTATGTGVLNWNAVPYSYPYTVYAATNVTGPYLPLKTGMVFPTSLGSYTDTNVTAKAKFYQITSP